MVRSLGFIVGIQISNMSVSSKRTKFGLIFIKLIDSVQHTLNPSKDFVLDLYRILYAIWKRLFGKISKEFISIKKFKIMYSKVSIKHPVLLNDLFYI